MLSVVFIGTVNSAESSSNENWVDAEINVQMTPKLSAWLQNTTGNQHCFFCDLREPTLYSTRYGVRFDASACCYSRSDCSAVTAARQAVVIQIRTV